LGGCKRASCFRRIGGLLGWALRGHPIPAAVALVLVLVAGVLVACRDAHEGAVCERVTPELCRRAGIAVERLALQWPASAFPQLVPNV
jgi:hypothetical protein